MKFAIDRRDWMTKTTKGAVAVAVIGTVPLMEGCSADQWIATALADLPTILQIITSILGIVSAASGGVDPGSLILVNRLGAEAKTDLQLAQTLIASYKAAASSAKPGILTKIDAALGTALGSLDSILTAFHTSNTTLATTIAAALGSSITIILAIQALIPAPPAATAARASLHNEKNQSAAMKTAYNLLVAKNYPNAII